MKSIRLGFLGTGQWASHVARTLATVPDIAVAACHSIDETECAAFARATGAKACASRAALLDRKQIDAVCIMTPNDTHREHALEAAAKGLHMFVEKPMANTLEDSIAMIAAARNAGVALFVGHNTRREARFRLMKRLMDEGAIGRALVGHVSFTSSAGLGHQLGSWRYDPARTRAVALAQIGIHAIDLLHSIFGPTVSVSADISSSGAAGSIQDLCMARLSFHGGAISSFNNAYSVARDRSLGILGTSGALISKDEVTLIQRNALGDEIVHVTHKNDTVREEFEEFAASCRGERQPETGGIQGAQAVAVMEAMILSSESRQIVPVNIANLRGES